MKLDRHTGPGKRSPGMAECNYVARIRRSIINFNVHAQLTTPYLGPLPLRTHGSIHLSIRVQSGPHCLLSKIFFIPLCESFAGLFLLLYINNFNYNFGSIIN